MQTARHSIEPLEARIAPAAIVTYIDVDGDTVTVKTSKGSASDLESILTFSDVNPTHPRQLQMISFDAKPSVFAGTDLTVTAKRSATGGDGFANVGYIDAEGMVDGTAIDLGKISIAGDLGRIDAGDGPTATTGVKRLTVQSLGEFGTSTQSSGDLVSLINGALGALKVAGNVRNAAINVLGGADSKIGSISIGGSLIGGSGLLSGKIITSGSIGAVKIGGNIEGGSNVDAGSIFTPATIASLMIGGSIIGGSEENCGYVYADIGMGPVSIGHDIRGGSGQNSGYVGTLGKVKSAAIGGSVLGGAGKFSGYLIFDGDTGTVTIGGDLRGGTGIASGVLVVDGNLAGLTIGGSVLGGTANRTGMIDVDGNIGPVKIGGDLVGGGNSGAGSVDSTGGIIIKSRVKSITIGGSIIAGTNSGGGTLTHSGAIGVDGDIASLTVKGSLIGNHTQNVMIRALGQIDPGKGKPDIAIGNIRIGGRIEHTQILAGYTTPFGAAQNADAQIGKVSVGGDWIASSLVAGVAAGGDGEFGSDDDAKIAGPGVKDSSAAISRIAGIVIQGHALGSVGAMESFGIVAQQIGSLKVGATTLPLATGASNDLVGLAVGATGNLTAREVA